MLEIVVALIVGSGFFVVGAAHLISPAAVLQLRAWASERYPFWYSRKLLWSGYDLPYHLVRRLAGALLTLIGFLILYRTFTLLLFG